MPRDARIDAGVREAVELLNRIPGVATRASCEGGGRNERRHRHADVAYVLFRYPLPLRLQDFLLTHMDCIARVEPDGVYSRWPDRNCDFALSLLTTARSYPMQQIARGRVSVCWRLPKLRARVARQFSHGQPVHVQLCLQCADLAFDGHPAAHQAVPVLHCGSDRPAVWFAEFVAQRGNVLDADLVETVGWANLILRTQRGEFGAAFQRRWLRYRARMLAELTTRHLRTGAEQAHHLRPDLECFYTDTHVTFEWQRHGD